MKRQPSPWLFVSTCAVLLTACGDSEVFAPPEDPPAFWLPWDVQPLLRSQAGLAPLPEQYSQEQLAQLTRSQLANIRGLDLSSFRQAQVSDHELRWLRLLPNLESLTIDLSEVLKPGDELATGSGIQFMRRPRPMTVDPELGLHALRELTITTNAIQSLEAFGSLPALERVTIRTRAPVDLTVFAGAHNLRALRIARPEGPHHMEIVGGEDIDDMARLQDLVQLQELDLGESGFIEDYAPLTALPKLRTLTASMPSAGRTLGLQALLQLRQLRLRPDTGAPPSEDAKTLAALRASLPDCDVQVLQR